MNPSSNGLGLLPPLDYYQLMRQRVEHEDNLIVQRLSWMVASQSFLFTAYAIVLNGLTSPPAPGAAHLVEQQQLLFRFIPVVGILTCMLIYVSILAAVASIRRLRNSYHSRFSEEERDVPPLQTSAPTRWFGNSAPLLLPVIFTAIWLVLWMRGY